MWSTKGQPAPPCTSRCAARSAGVKMLRNSERTMASRAARPLEQSVVVGTVGTWSVWGRANGEGGK